MNNLLLIREFIQAAIVVFVMIFLASVFQYLLFKRWMRKLKKIAIEDMPYDYKQGDKWCDEYFKKTYYDKGYSATDAWDDYTTMVQ